MSKDLSNIDYKMECTTPSDYELTLTLQAENKLFLMLFNKAKMKLLRQKGIKVGDSNPEVIDQFEVPDYYYNFIKVTIRNLYKQFRDKFKKSKIELLSYEVGKAKFKRNENKDWNIIILMKGMYADKR